MIAGLFKPTPTQDLILEVLAARYRLGEDLWTFDSRHKTALRQLEEAGLVTLIHGTVYRTVRASLTERGVAESLTNVYTAPLFSDQWTNERKNNWPEVVRKAIKKAHKKFKETS